MRKNIIRSASLILFSAVTLLHTGCVKDKVQTTYTYYTPVYAEKAAVLQNIKSNPAQPLQQTGKLIKYGNYIFLNEINKGIHVIDNSNPAAPQNIAFITVPGNLDLSVKNNILYVDIYTDLLTIDISNVNNIVIKNVMPAVFPERMTGLGYNYDSTKYIVNWDKHITASKVEFDKYKTAAPSGGVNYLSTAAITTGSISGSMSRFTIVNDYLYTAGSVNLTALDISVPANPVIKQKKMIGSNIETIFPFQDKLFIGSETGMMIYSITDPSNPMFLRNFSHACFSDPVIADNDYAYVTLRAKQDVSPCWGAPALQKNEMDLVNVKDMQNIFLEKVYDMTEPKGLCKDGNLLFLCDGSAGLKVFNVADPKNMQLIKQFTGINTFDVIAQSGLAIVIADKGLYQYDYTDVNNIKLLSKININN